MKKYQHKVQYYETDKMGIVHHSNYIKWMESSEFQQGPCSAPIIFPAREGV